MFLCLFFKILIYKRESIQRINTLKSLSFMTKLWILVINLKSLKIFQYKRIMGEDINCLYIKLFQNSKHKKKLSRDIFPFPSILLLLLKKKSLLFWKYTAVHSYKWVGNVTSIWSTFNVTIKLYQLFHVCTDEGDEFCFIKIVLH